MIAIPVAGLAQRPAGPYLIVEEIDPMRVASEAALKRAAEVRRSGKSWFELTATAESREASLKFFRGARSPHVADRPNE